VLLVITKIHKNTIHENEVLKNKHNMNIIVDTIVKTLCSLSSEAYKGKSLNASNELSFEV
jgi:hypothetical protein